MPKAVAINVFGEMTAILSAACGGIYRRQKKAVGIRNG
jgi:hypothetical protein